MKLKLAIFDLDGTLLDTFGDLTSAVNAALGASGFLPRGEDEVRRFVGDGVKKLIDRAVPEGTPEPAAERVCRKFRAEYDARVANATRPYPGIESALKFLKENGVKTAVLSNKPDAAAKALIARFFPDFDFVSGETEGTPRKPDPKGALGVMKAFGADKGETVLIGDSPQDAETARNAGIAFAAVLWGARNREDFSAFAVPFFANKTEDLISYFSCFI